MPFSAAADSQLVGRRVLHNQITQIVVEYHQLKQTDTSFVSCRCAAIASRAAIEFAITQLLFFDFEIEQHVIRRLDFLTALRTDSANQPLGQDRLDRCSDHERLHAHILQSRDRAWRVVGVQRAKYRVTRQNR